ncbi:Coiled-coil domain-containing protein 112 [Frankliniella fusca]|uniref:Coiled-coil domain-containing protein 112 n=1 Tax=Frankliniella fusca TaxID=407009 RepID=A0AAE1GXS6_9NEOP|nr:Coiled-coil domain-containing protein 112 [Frankliniella fusca]
MKPNRAQRVETNLSVQQEVFERAYSSLINGLKYVDKKYLENLKSVQNESEVERKRETQNLQKSLLAIIMVIQKLKHNIKNKHFIENHDTDYFRNQLTNIEENLASFKGLLVEQIQNLQDEEKDLQHSIDSLQLRLNEARNSSTTNQSESSYTNAVREKAKSRVCTQTGESVHPDVHEFHQFLQNNGGHTGGWDTKDHLLFTRFLQKYRGLDQMTTALLDFMPDKSPQEIAQHESWYHDYLTLKDAQRRALKEWRNEQSSIKNKSETIQETADCSVTSVSQNFQTTIQRDPSIKEKIKKWKEKQEKLRQEQIQDLQDKKRQEDELWRKKVAYFEQQRQKIAKKRKDQQLQAEKDIGEPNGAQIPKKQIPLKELWEQDKLYMLRRQSRIQRFSASPRERHTSQSTVYAERDPARLLRPTAVWSNRVRRSLSEDGGKKPQASLYIADVPRLAIPKWREGLM